MDPTLKRKVATATAALAVLGGAGGTYAATRGSGGGEREAFLADAAKRLDVSPKELKAALEAAFSDRLDAAVAAGRLTRAEANEIKRRAKEHGGSPPFPGGFHRGPLGGAPPGGFHGGFHGGPFLGGIDAAAKYLGLSEARLRERLESGKSLAAVARERRKSVAGLKKAIEDSIRRKLDAAVADKRLTRSQERRILSELDRHIDAMVRRSGAGPRLHWRGPRGGPGPGRPHWGGPPGL